jgi:hypothetical protein
MEGSVGRSPFHSFCGLFKLPDVLFPLGISVLSYKSVDLSGDSRLFSHGFSGMVFLPFPLTLIRVTKNQTKSPNSFFLFASEGIF